MPERRSSGGPARKRIPVHRLPPAIVLGGDVIALSVMRSLGRMGVKVYCINQRETNRLVVRSRYCHRFVAVPADRNIQEAWKEILLGGRSNVPAGAVLLACGDDALEFLIDHYPDLERKYRLDIMDRQAQRSALNKLSTYQAAAKAGVPVPVFHKLSRRTLSDLDSGQIPFPCLVKPVHSHRFLKSHNFKHYMAADRQALDRIVREMPDDLDDFILLEYIEGPDDLLCSYYTYIDDDGAPRFDFTKRIIRRYPVTSGLGCYHITDAVESVKALSLRFLREIGLKGVANVEFKMDNRDGCLKIIECNARYTAANSLLMESGIDLPAIVYRRILGMTHVFPATFATGRRLWRPNRDYRAFLELRRRGELTLPAWLKSVLHPQTFPYFAWDDPAPSIDKHKQLLERRMRRCTQIL